MASMNVSLFHSPSPSFRAKIIWSQPKRLRGVNTRSSLSGRESESLKSEVNKFGSILEHKKRFQLSARVTSDNFPVKKSGFLAQLRDTLSKLGVPSGVLEFVFGWIEDKDYPQIPEAKGSLKQIRSRLLILFLHELYFTHGPIIRLKVGPKSIVVVSDPSTVKHILKDNAKAYSKGILAEILEFVMGNGLIPADGEIWRVRRRAIVPALHLKFLAAMMNLFGQATDRLCQKLEASIRDRENVEMESMFSHMTLDITGKAVFNYDFDSLRNDTGIVEAVYTVLNEADMRSIETIPSWAIPIWKDISPRHKKVSKALKLINDTLDNLISICKRMVEEEGDQFNDDYVNDKDPSILRFLLASGDDVSSKQLRDDLMTLLIAGHETTASTLTWTFHLLSQNPSAMTKLQQEVDSILGNRFPNIEDMKKLKYTTRVINESLRLYPHPPFLVRRALEKDMLGQYPIKRGTDIFISVWNLHHSPTLWENVEEFIPERWALDGPDPNETNQNFRYMAFGGGPRKCIGYQFATYEAVVALSMLMRRFEFKMAIDAPQVNMTTGGTIHTTEGLLMTVIKRVTHTGEVEPISS